MYSAGLSIHNYLDISHSTDFLEVILENFYGSGVGDASDEERVGRGIAFLVGIGSIFIGSSLFVIVFDVKSMIISILNSVCCFSS